LLHTIDKFKHIPTPSCFSQPVFRLFFFKI